MATTPRRRFLKLAVTACGACVAACAGGTRRRRSGARDAAFDDLLDDAGGLEAGFGEASEAGAVADAAEPTTDAASDGIDAASDAANATGDADLGRSDAATDAGAAANERRLPLADLSQLIDGDVIKLGDVLVARDGDGFYAMTAVCPHEGCLVFPAAEASSCPGQGDAPLVCPCHCSLFDLAGTSIAGPAGGDLRHFDLRIEGDESIVDVRSEVPADTRIQIAPST